MDIGKLVRTFTAEPVISPVPSEDREPVGSASAALSPRPAPDEMPDTPSTLAP